MNYCNSQKSENYDAFGRLRVSQPLTLFDSTNRYQMNKKWYSNTTNGGTVSYVSNESTVYLTTTTSPASKVFRETRNVFSYQPGKSLLILQTFVMSVQTSNLTQRIGYFGNDNGVYIEQAGNTTNIVKRNNGSETRIPQTQWNGNQLINVLDLSRSQILWMDIEWLGVGDVRVGFIIDSEYVTCHTFRHANRSTSTYMTTASLPCRYEIFNTGVTTSNNSMKQICTTVISEGGYNPQLPMFSMGVTSTINTTLVPLCSVRLKSVNLDAMVIIKQIDLLVSSIGIINWYLISDATIVDGTWVSHASSNLVQVNTTATTVSGGITVTGGLAYQRSTNMVDLNIYGTQIGRFTNPAGVLTSEVFTLAAYADGTNTGVSAMVSWSEI